MEDIDDINLICEECGVLNTNETVCVHYSSELGTDVAEVNVESRSSCIEEVLISLVEARPPLWDSRLPIQRRSKTIRDDLWQEVCVLLGDRYSVEMLQKKWKNLRDTYIRARSEENAYVPSGSATKKRKKPWKYSELMTFLSETVAPRTTISNLQSADSPLPSPDSENSTSTTSKAKKTVEHHIIEAINKLPPPSALIQEKKINPICIQLSNIFEQLPSRKRAKLEISFLTQAYAALHETEI